MLEFKEQATLLDLTVRIFCLEKILIEKGLISKEELIAEYSEASTRLLKDILKASNYQGDLDEAIDLIKSSRGDKVN